MSQLSRCFVPTCGKMSMLTCNPIPGIAACAKPGAMHGVQEARDIIKRLLTHNPTQRLGSGKGGASDVKVHAWFSGFDWTAFAKRQLKAPYVPQVLPFDPGMSAHAVHACAAGCPARVVHRLQHSEDGRTTDADPHIIDMDPTAWLLSGRLSWSSIRCGCRCRPRRTPGISAAERRRRMPA